MIALLLSLTLHAADLNSPENLSVRCAPQTSADEILYNSDFHWDYDLPALKKRAEEIYVSPKRLDRHAYWNGKALVLPYDAERGGEVAVPARLIMSVQRHLEEAFRNDYIDAVFFPDLGHSHLLIPNDSWESKYSKIPTNQISRFYEQVFDDPNLQIAYHAAEQLRMRGPDGRLVDDRRVQWRFFSRSLVGDNRGEGRLDLLQDPSQSMNAISGREGFYWYGAGFNISANQNGCLAATVGGKELRFDLSLYDLPSPPGGEYDP